MEKIQKILKIIAILFLSGGIVRLFANEMIFRFAGIGSLWINDSFFIYIYKVLGAFVIFCGLILYAVAENIRKYLALLGMIKWGMLIIALTMLVTGIYVNLPLIFFAPDFSFCFIIALILYYIVKNKSRYYV